LLTLILFAEGSLRTALTEFQMHYHHERNHQGKGDVLLLPGTDEPARDPRAIDPRSKEDRRPSHVLSPSGRRSFVIIRGKFSRFSRASWVVRVPIAPTGR
jgi:hypothetical protein